MSTSEIKIDYVFLLSVPHASPPPHENLVSEDTRLTKCKETLGTYFSTGCKFSSFLPLTTEDLNLFWEKTLYLLTKPLHHESKSYRFSFGIVMKILVPRTSNSNSFKKNKRQIFQSLAQ